MCWYTVFCPPCIQAASNSFHFSSFQGITSTPPPSACVCVRVCLVGISNMQLHFHCSLLYHRFVASLVWRYFPSFLSSFIQLVLPAAVPYALFSMFCFVLDGSFFCLYKPSSMDLDYFRSLNVPPHLLLLYQLEMVMVPFMVLINFECCFFYFKTEKLLFHSGWKVSVCQRALCLVLQASCTTLIFIKQ